MIYDIDVTLRLEVLREALKLHSYSKEPPTREDIVETTKRFYALVRDGKFEAGGA